MNYEKIQFEREIIDVVRSEPLTNEAIKIMRDFIT